MRRWVALVILFVAFPLRAQEWEAVGGERFTFITATDDSALLMVDEPREGRNMLLRSSDLGETWQVVYRAMTTLTGVQPSPYPPAQAGEGKQLLLLSDSDVVAESGDNGRTWQEPLKMNAKPEAKDSLPAALYPLPEGTLSYCKLGDNYVACGELGRVSIYSAHAWRSVHSAAFTAARNLSLDFANKACGIISDSGSIYSTHDSALTWRESKLTLHPTPYTLNPVLMLSDTEWLAGMDSGRIASTSDAGATYRYDALTTSRPIHSISWRDKTFREISIVTDSAVYVARPGDLHSASLMWSRGSDTTMNVRSTAWPTRYTGFVLVDTMYHLDSLQADWDGIVRDSSLVRHFGNIYRTTDGGATWTAVERMQRLNNISFFGAASVFACGDLGNVCKSDDSGSEWSCFRTWRTQNLNAIQFLTESSGIAVGDSGIVLLSQNTSASSSFTGRWWRPFAPVALALHPKTRYTSIASADAHTVYIVGSDSAGSHVWRTTVHDPPPRMKFHWPRGDEKAPPLKVYPNPVSTSLHVEGNSGPVSVLDEYGQSYPAQMSDGAIDVSNLSPGVYFVTDGKRKARFVKE